MGAIIVSLFAAAVATLVRLYDPPVVVNTGLIVSTFVYSLIAAGITAWVGMESGLVIATAGGFAVVAGAAVGGMATIKAFLARAGAT